MKLYWIEGGGKSNNCYPHKKRGIWSQKHREGGHVKMEKEVKLCCHKPRMLATIRRQKM
jgi:hypothetical protein